MNDFVSAPTALLFSLRNELQVPFSESSGGGRTLKDKENFLKILPDDKVDEVKKYQWS